MNRPDTYCCPDCGNMLHYRPCGNRTSHIQAALEKLAQLAMMDCENKEEKISILVGQIEDDLETTGIALMRYRKVYIYAVNRLSDARITISELLDNVTRSISNASEIEE